MVSVSIVNSEKYQLKIGNNSDNFLNPFYFIYPRKQGREKMAASFQLNRMPTKPLYKLQIHGLLITELRTLKVK